MPCFSSHFICKTAGGGLAVPWHEDSSYWGTCFDPMNVVTIWLAIDPSTPVNGNMQVIPRSHDNGYSAYEEVEGQVFDTRIRQDLIDESKAVDCTLKAGEYSVHHAKLIHGSQPNNSAMRRCGLTIRYAPATSKWQPEANPHLAEHQIYLVRGDNRNGNVYGRIGEVNEGFVARRPLQFKA